MFLLFFSNTRFPKIVFLTVLYHQNIILYIHVNILHIKNLFHGPFFMEHPFLFFFYYFFFVLKTNTTHRNLINGTDQLSKEARLYLCTPGPNLLVLDEGHRIRDPKSQLFAA